MFATEGAFEPAYQCAGLFGDGPHLGALATAQVEDRAHMQGANRGVGVPGSLRAVALETRGQFSGVLGQMLQGYCTIFDERDGFAAALHRHHEVQPGLANLPQHFLGAFVWHLNDRSGQPQITHADNESSQRGELLVS